jgi:hypothetical protein
VDFCFTAESFAEEGGGRGGKRKGKACRKERGGGNYELYKQLLGGEEVVSTLNIFASSIYILFVFTFLAFISHTPCPVCPPLTNIGGQSEAGAYR